MGLLVQSDFDTQVLNGLVNTDQVMVEMEVNDDGDDDPDYNEEDDDGDEEEDDDTDDDGEEDLVLPATFRACDFEKGERQRVNIAVGLDRFEGFTPPQDGRGRYPFCAQTVMCAAFWSCGPCHVKSTNEHFLMCFA